MNSRVKLEVLFGPTSVCSDLWATAVEKLAIGLSRDRFCVVRVPELYGTLFKAALLGVDTPALVSSPGCSAIKYRGGGDNYVLDACSDGLELVARSVLQGVCRSNLLRLRSDTFSGILDDLPLPKSQQSSSEVTLQEFADNYSKESGGGSHHDGQQVFSDPQGEVTDMGLLSVMVPLEAQDQEGRQLSVLQAKDACGEWRDVVVGAGEVVVVVGRTMRHVTAGVLAPTVFRVAGNPYGGVGGGRPRRALHFQLLPRPGSLLDFHKQLQEAGHAVPPQYAAPASVEALMQQFGGTVTPGQVVRTPGNTEGMPQVLTFGGSDFPRGRKRSSEAAELATALDDRPVLEDVRFDHARHERGKPVPNSKPGTSHTLAERKEAQADATSGGGEWAAGRGGSSRQALVPKERRSSADGPCSVAPPQRGVGGSGEGPGRSGGLMVVGGHTCILLEGGGQGAGAGSLVRMCVKSTTGVERWFLVSRRLTYGRLFEAYCDRMGISLGAVKFTRRGKRVFGADKLKGLRDGVELLVVPESLSTVRPGKELGALFCTLMGTEAVAENPI